MQTQDKIAVSIFIPTIGRFDYLKKAVESILSQTKLPTEVIIGYNGCKEPEWAAEFQSQFEELGIKFHSYENPGRLPMTKSWERGILACKNDFVNVLADDDMLHPQFLENAGKHLFSKEPVDVYACPYISVNEDGAEISTPHLDQYFRSLSCERTLVTKDSFWFESTPTIMSMVFSKSTFLKSLMHEAGFSFDVWSFREMANKNYFLYYDKVPYVYYRIYAGSMSQSASLQLACDDYDGWKAFTMKHGSVKTSIPKFISAVLCRQLIKPNSAKLKIRVVNRLLSSPSLLIFAVYDTFGFLFGRGEKTMPEASR